ncbi:hypothetical protein [Streptacidiphilus albus]|uniref:hypothetical protein n=1 Tax=Streptacidiphilus albus TaxID=105425 RepID=UPI00054B36EB|nr:hypothetical protein [Streptacidiphilus albus]
MLGNATNTWNWSRISGLSAVAALGAGALAALRGSRTRQGAAVATAGPEPDICIDGSCPPSMPTPPPATLDAATGVPDSPDGCIDGWCPPHLPTPVPFTPDEGSS